MASAIKERLSQKRYDAIVVGSGPNGLAAAILLLQRGYSVAVIEGQSTAGGGSRSAELTLPGFIHDVCSSVHPLGIGSPIFRTFPLDKFGLEWIHPDAPFAHPFDGGKSVVVHRSIEQTAYQLGVDAASYRKLMGWLVPSDWDELCDALRHPVKLARYPVAMMRFGMNAMKSARSFADAHYRGPLARGMFAGVAAHTALKLDGAATASFGMVLGLAAHAGGWPMARGGSQSITDALIKYMRSLGGELLLDAPLTNIDELPEHRFVFLDITPRQILKIAGGVLPSTYVKQLENFKYGPATYKMDWALDGPIPWQSEGCRKAGTVHIGATFEEIGEAELGNWNGEQPSEHPYVLLAQTSLFDKTRAPEGKQTVWAYCHVPNASTVDMSKRIENQIERFAPGFKNLILARAITDPALMEKKNANYVGGDINGGALNFAQLFTRPVIRPIPYKLPLKGAYICSAASPPGGGVHGMCGYYAFQAAMMSSLRD